MCDYFSNSYYQNQNLSVARIFRRFWSCANCESTHRGLASPKLHAHKIRKVFPNVPGAMRGGGAFPRRGGVFLQLENYLIVQQFLLFPPCFLTYEYKI